MLCHYTCSINLLPIDTRAQRIIITTNAARNIFSVLLFGWVYGSFFSILLCLVYMAGLFLSFSCIGIRFLSYSSIYIMENKLAANSLRVYDRYISRSLMLVPNKTLNANKLSTDGIVSPCSHLYTAYVVLSPKYSLIEDTLNPLAIRNAFKCSPVATISITGRFIFSPVLAAYKTALSYICNSYVSKTSLLLFSLGSHFCFLLVLICKCMWTDSNRRYTA